ncbi:MAG TPA: hypothetical protein PLK28_07340 [Candidatus Rifleibacterium sp.]|jgi:hypothetical protein|nr:hypothetical protein [Candidatus Rifleibacterium sp.]HOI90309.1 hypothetical protein [Candidatus Rifleibacterium sp.]HPW59131.1 hypothetical protein [Candidatus Rifleibacterium sp.]HQB84755.1 hypothetical protein [Candidatus Rifleibacterium sp.]
MSRKGVSLLEILFASGIMVAAMVPLWGLMGSSHKQVTLSADEIRASQIAAEILEQIENSGWQPEVGEISFAPVSEGKISLGATSKIDVHVGSFPAYMEVEARLKIDKHPATGPEYGKIVRLILNYKSKEKVGTPQKDYELSTFIGRRR